MIELSWMHQGRAYSGSKSRAAAQKELVGSLRNDQRPVTRVELPERPLLPRYLKRPPQPCAPPVSIIVHPEFLFKPAVLAFRDQKKGQPAPIERPPKAQ